MLPNSITIHGVEYPLHASSGDEKIYTSIESVFSVRLREDAQGRIQERLQCIIGLGSPIIDSGWSSFENAHSRKMFLKVVNAYYDRYPNELPN